MNYSIHPFGEEKMARTPRVLVVDDSPTRGRIISQILQSSQNIEVLGIATDARSARESIRSMQPDVVTLDLDLVRFDAIDFLEKLMLARPMPVVVLAEHTSAGGAATLRALELGAIDYVIKPSWDVLNNFDEVSRKVTARVLISARGSLRASLRAVSDPWTPGEKSVRRTTKYSDHVIVVGAETGGAPALARFLGKLPANAPAVLVAFPMPSRFTPVLAEWLNDRCALTVREAEHGEKPQTGTVLIAPGNKHMRLRRHARSLVVELDDEASIQYHRPSIDALFASAATATGGKTIGVLLSGSGHDGAEGLLRIHADGGHTMVQDEWSSVTFDMQRRSIELDAAQDILPLESLSKRVVQILGESESQKKKKKTTTKRKTSTVRR